MFLEDIQCEGKRQFKAVIYDAVLFGRHWGFELDDIRVPVRMWHGDADSLVPLDHAEWMCDVIPDCELVVDPGEAHLGGLDRIGVRTPSPAFGRTVLEPGQHPRRH